MKRVLCLVQHIGIYTDRAEIVYAQPIHLNDFYAITQSDCRCDDNPTGYIVFYDIGLDSEYARFMPKHSFRRVYQVSDTRNIYQKEVEHPFTARLEHSQHITKRYKHVEKNHSNRAITTKL